MTTQAVSLDETLERVFDRAMRSQPEIQHIVIAAENGLVVAHRARAKGKELRLAALAPVVNDAGEQMFNELELAPLGEVLLLGSEGTAYLIRMKAHPAFVLLSAKGQVNVGLLRMIANRIEAEASEVLRDLLP